MFEIINHAVELLRGLSSAQIAKLSAYWLAPGSILLLTISGLFGNIFAIGSAQPVTVSELKSEISLSGETTSKPGIALIIEPDSSEFRVPFHAPISRIWSSLDQNAARENKSRLELDSRGVSIRSPFLHIGDPVMLVIEGQIGQEFHLPGGAEMVDDLLLRSKRSLSIVTSVLLACVFAFGMSSAVGLVSSDRK
jgi:hypothetical protein